MKVLKLTLLIIIILLFASVSQGSVSLPFSSTFNCPDWVYPAALNCDGWSGGLSADYNEEINATANYSGGGGGKGLYHTNADGVGTSPHSGGVSLYFDTPQTHIWIRWYQYMEAGWTANWSSWKVIYLYSSTNNPGYIQLGYPGNGGARMFGGGSYDSSQTCSTCAYGYAFGNSEWVLHEVEVDISGGAARWWINENLIIEATGITWNSLTNVDNILIPSNIKDVGNGQVVHSYFDDIAISNTGYIGAINSPPADTTPPVVSVTNPIDSSTVSGDIAFSANATDAVGVVGVQFKIDGVNVGAEDTSSPYSITIDTTTLTDASHSFTAVARDAAGNSTTSSTISVTVDNTVLAPGELLLYEPAEDLNLTSRGWYDATSTQVLDNTEYAAVNGSTGSLKYHFAPGATTPDSGGAMRIIFPETDDVYLSYYVKYSSSYIGSGSSSHPHELFFMSKEDTDFNAYTGPNDVFLHLKIEQNSLIPRLILVDNKRISTAHGTPPIDLTSVTQIRASTGCNGELGVGGTYDCYSSGGGWFNGKFYDYNFPIITTNVWHKVQVRAKLNTVSGSTTNADGILKYWLDGVLLINYDQVVYRTSYYPNDKFNQFGIAPYISDGSPVDQTFWLDEIYIYNGVDEEVIYPVVGFQGIQTSGSVH